MTFTVTKTGASEGAVSVDFATADGKLMAQTSPNLETLFLLLTGKELRQ